MELDVAVKVLQIDPYVRNGVVSPFRYRNVEWVARFLMTRPRVFGWSDSDDRVFREITEWCRERFSEPMHFDRDYPVNWAVNDFLSSACAIYFRTSDQALEFKLRWV
jgi:hypothetical protein